jgi:hypothetical protein
MFLLSLVVVEELLEELMLELKVEVEELVVV